MKLTVLLRYVDKHFFVPSISVLNDLLTIKAGSQHGQPEINPETASIPGQNASSGTRKSSSKTSVRSKASKTSLKSTSSSRASLKKEASPEVQ